MRGIVDLTRERKASFFLGGGARGAEIVCKTVISVLRDLEY